LNRRVFRASASAVSTLQFFAGARVDKLTLQSLMLNPGLTERRHVFRHAIYIRQRTVYQLKMHESSDGDPFK